MTNEQRRKSRLYKKIKTALNHYVCTFLTLTFNDATLETTSEKTRERYIKTFLKNETAFYIANKDFGSKNTREHYHALIIASTLNKNDLSDDLKPLLNQINLNAYKYGNIYASFIASKWQFKGDKNYSKTSEHITNHFYKSTTKQSRILQSRAIPDKAKQIERIKRLKIEKEKAIEKRKNEAKHIDFMRQEINEMLSAKNGFTTDFLNIPTKKHYLA